MKYPSSSYICLACVTNERLHNAPQVYSEYIAIFYCIAKKSAPFCRSIGDRKASLRLQRLRVKETTTGVVKERKKKNNNKK